MELKFDKHIYECKVTCKANGQSLIKRKILRILFIFSVTFNTKHSLFPTSSCIFARK